MSYPVLIAQTPRAGKWNHLNLLPGRVPTGLEVADYLSAASTVAERQGETRGFIEVAGGNYLAVANRVTQTTGRGGLEVLALVGLKVPSGPERESIMKDLRNHLAALAELIERHPWSSHDGSDLRREELGEWQNGLISKHALRPHPGRTRGPLAEDERVSPGEWMRGRRPLLFIGLILLVLAVGSVLGLNVLVCPTGSQKTDPSPKSVPTRLTGEQSPEPPPGWKEFLEEYNPTENAKLELVRQLARALNGTGRTPGLPTEVLEGRLKDLAPGAMAPDVQDLVWGKAEFKGWLGRAYPPAKKSRTSDWFYLLGEPSVVEQGHRERISAFVGNPKDVAQVRAWKERLAQLHEFLRACGGGRPAEYGDMIEQRHLTAWLKSLADFPAGKYPEGSRLPFVTTHEAEVYDAVLGKVNTLKEALAKHKLVNSDSAFRWDDLSDFRQVGEVIHKEWKDPKSPHVILVVAIYGGRGKETDAVRALLSALRDFPETPTTDKK